jgi:dethiobiotin synthetase
MTTGFFLTGPGTSAGKTFVARALTHALRRSGQRPIALKPIETGAAPLPADAIALARASGHPQHASDPAFFRAALPLAPYAACLETNSPTPNPRQLAERVRTLAADATHLVVEGAGGLLVPLGAATTIADLARALELPLLVVARDELGVLSSVLTCLASAHAHELQLAAVVLNRHAAADTDLSPRTNRRILQERLPFPVFAFPHTHDDDDALADAAEACGLVALLRSAPR